MEQDDSQLSFDLEIPSQRIVRPSLPALVTKDGLQLVLAAGHDTLVHDPDGLVSRVVKPHSSKKAFKVRRYATMVGTGMKDSWFGNRRYWIELHAGPAQLFEHPTGIFLPGSPIDALTIRDPFTHYVFVECNELCERALRERTREYPNVTVIRGDCNDELVLDQIRAIVPDDALVTIYADAEDLDDLDFNTVKYFTARYPHVDWWINFAGPGAARYLRAGGEGRVVSLLEHERPAQILEDEIEGTYATRLLLYFIRQLRGLGYQCQHETILHDQNNTPLYELIFATRDKTGTALGFFNKACGIKANGQRTLFDLSVGA